MVNPGRLAVTGVVELLDVESLMVERLGITQQDLTEFIGQQRGLSGLRVAMEEGWIRVDWRLPGPTLSGRRAMAVGTPPDPFTLRATDVRYGGVRPPALLLDWIVRNFDPTPRLRRLPMTVARVPVHIRPQRLEVGADAATATKESR